MTAPGTKKLGALQVEVLDALMRHGRWFPWCGWTWKNHSTTRRVLESLVNAGYAKKTFGERDWYTPTDRVSQGYGVYIGQMMEMLVRGMLAIAQGGDS